MVETTVDISQVGAQVTAGFRGAGFWLEILAFVVLFVVILIMIWYMLSFNVTLQVEEFRHKNHFVRQMKGKLIYDKKKDGQNVIQRLKIYGIKKTVMLPYFVKDEIEKNPDGTVSKYESTFKGIYATTKKGKLALRLIKEGDDFHVVPWIDVEVKEYLRVSKPTRMQWANNMMRELYELFPKKKDGWEKYGGAIMFGGTLVLITIIFIMLFNKFEYIKDYSAALNNYASALMEFTKAVRETNVQPL